MLDQCPQCGSIDLEDNGLRRRDPDYTLRCVKCDHRWPSQEALDAQDAANDAQEPATGTREGEAS